MPCVVPNVNESTPTSKKAKYHVIHKATHKTLMRLMNEIPDYKKTAAIIRISEKSAHRLCKTYLKTGTVLLLEKSKHQPVLLVKEYLWAIQQWIKRNCHFELENIQSIVESTFGIEALCQGPECPVQPAAFLRGQTTRSLETFTNCLPDQEKSPFDKQMAWN
ncbi:hypothetical protein DSO57_1020085 [Entomophthora muscae]|uniref:Uncharacterized protein n=1 Tax=Entomophthora muscae TaxID=34485 RepID=A0ACC2T3U3_9FUNG|nr:hypothetical protein DSO57_1020085 [Entomophthora muscae]